MWLHERSDGSRRVQHITKRSEGLPRETAISNGSARRLRPSGAKGGAWEADGRCFLGKVLDRRRSEQDGVRSQQGGEPLTEDFETAFLPRCEGD